MTIPTAYHAPGAITVPSDRSTTGTGERPTSSASKTGPWARDTTTGSTAPGASGERRLPAPPSTRPPAARRRDRGRQRGRCRPSPWTPRSRPKSAGPDSAPTGPTSCTARRRHRGQRRGADCELERVATGKLPLASSDRGRISAAYFRYYAGVLREPQRPDDRPGRRRHAYTRLEPYGVVGVITPWNLPLNQACRAVAPALAVGNAVVAKPSEFTSTTTVRLARLASEAGLPDGVFNVVTGTGPDVGTPLAATRGSGASRSPVRSPPAVTWPRSPPNA